MALDPVVNFGVAQINGAVLSTDLTINLVAGQGANLPLTAAGAFNAPVWDSGVYGGDSTAAYLDGFCEIVRVTANASDILTVTRAQEGTTALNFNTDGHTYSIGNSLTAKMITDIAALIASSVAAIAVKNSFSVNATGQNLGSGTTTYTTFGCIGTIPNVKGTYRLYLPPGTIRNLHCNAMSTGGNGTCSITVFKNGNATSLTVAGFATANASYNPEQTDLNPTHAFSVVAGDYIEVAIAPVTYTVTQFYAYVEFDPS